MPRRLQGPLYVELDNGCWQFQGCTDDLGYGHMYHPEKKRSCLAHRYFYEQKHDEVPDTLDHTCRNPSCVNPDHLEPIGRGENIRRGKTAKITWEGARHIRRSSLAPKELAEVYGVAPCTISNIRAGRNWAEAA